ncbi:MAG: rhodanese-like domain-containing protein, partial [Gallionella sp.]
MKFNASKVQWTLIAVFVALFGWNQLQAAQGIDVKQAQTMQQQGALLLDVREPNEYAEIHAPNVTLIPLGELSTRLNEIAPFKDKPIAVMCRSGKRSAKAVALLEAAGYSQVSNVSGGMNAWESA